MAERADDLTADLLLSVIERQAQQGVDYMTVQSAFSGATCRWHERGWSAS